MRSGHMTGTLRILGAADTAALTELAAADPVANTFLLSHLETTGTAAPTASGGQVLGMFDGGKLTAACWAGVNVVPTGVSAETGPEFGAYLASTGRRFSSLFGPAEAVLSLWSQLQHTSPRPFDVRSDQPLLEITGPSRGSAGTGTAPCPACGPGPAAAGLYSHVRGRSRLLSRGRWKPALPAAGACR